MGLRLQTLFAQGSLFVHEVKPAFLPNQTRAVKQQKNTRDNAIRNCIHSTIGFIAWKLVRYHHIFHCLHKHNFLNNLYSSSSSRQSRANITNCLCLHLPKQTQRGKEKLISGRQAVSVFLLLSLLLFFLSLSLSQYYTAKILDRRDTTFCLLHWPIAVPQCNVPLHPSLVGVKRSQKESLNHWHSRYLYNFTWLMKLNWQWVS